MKLWVYSEMLIRSVEPHDEPHIIISIYTPGGPRARFKTHKTATHAVLFVEFPDMNEHYWEIPVEQRIYRDDQIFNATHANEILDFVDDHRDVESILCQCEGGLSRSVAVKAALDTLLNEDMTPYDGTNALVYNTLLETAAARAKR